MPTSEKDSDSWSTADKLKVVLESAGLNANDTNAKTIIAMAE